MCSLKVFLCFFFSRKCVSWRVSKKIKTQHIYRIHFRRIAQTIAILARGKMLSDKYCFHLSVNSKHCLIIKRSILFKLSANFFVQGIESYCFYSSGLFYIKRGKRFFCKVLVLKHDEKKNDVHARLKFRIFVKLVETKARQTATVLVVNVTCLKSNICFVYVCAYQKRRSTSHIVRGIRSWNKMNWNCRYNKSLNQSPIVTAVQLSPLKLGSLWIEI